MQLNQLCSSELGSVYQQFTRQQWSLLRKEMPLSLAESDLISLCGVNEVISLTDIEEIYLPLSRLLTLFVAETKNLAQITRQFLKSSTQKVPYVIGVAGSVAVGKSTTARVLQRLLSHQESIGRVSLISTDGFLHPMSFLEQHDLVNKKGFPESYDMSAMLNFLYKLKSGQPGLKVPVYSHHHYDIVPGEYVEVDRPDILIIEGLNILRTPDNARGTQQRLFVSDFIDFSVYVDADADHIRQWFIDRVITFYSGSFIDKDSYFNYLTDWDLDKVINFANNIWSEINEVNLLENILPFRQRATLVLHKNIDHSVENIYLRRL